MTQKFENGKIYKLTNDFNDDVYVGSTCDTLVRRFIGHEKDMKSEINKNRPIYKLMNDIGFNRFRIQLIEDYPCEDKYQLRQREGYFIREMGTLNRKIEGRTIKEYQEDNYNILKQKDKEYYINNQEKIKEYYINNLEKIKERMKEYRNVNKEKIKDKKKEKITCICGCILTKNSLTEHQKTVKHKQLIQEQEQTEEA